MISLLKSDAKVRLFCDVAKNNFCHALKNGRWKKNAYGLEKIFMMICGYLR